MINYADLLANNGKVTFV